VATCFEIEWPAGRWWLHFAMMDANVKAFGPTTWLGSLLYNKTDGNGLLYMRNRYYDPQTGQFTQQDPIGIAGGLNLYGFANGDPVNFADPFGLCGTSGDSIKTKVTVDCPDGSQSKKDVWIHKAAPNEVAAVDAAAQRLTGGSANYTPGDVQFAYGAVTTPGNIYRIPMTAGGYPVAVGGLTQTGGGQEPWVAFRSDVLSLIGAGDLGRTMGNLGFDVATIVGHEGTHLLGAREPQALRVKWGFRP